ncbi:MAG: hypothetical protein ACKVRP_04130 [Bacteroidota bacterium]
MKTKLKVAAFVVLVLAFMYFVYPTRYIYLDVPFQSSRYEGHTFSFPIRVDRLTGKTEYFGIGEGTAGWIEATR